jgi:hypothetical protein
MSSDAYIPYAPLNALKPFAENLWIVDGREITMRFLGIAVPFATRMTVVRLVSGVLWIHSPIAWNEALAEAIRALGPVRFLVAPNTLHYWYLADWQKAFPEARSYGPPGLAARARKPVVIDEMLDTEPPADWNGEFDLSLAAGHLLTELVFFHRASRTLIITDLIENFELGRVRDPWVRRAIRWSGSVDPDGKAPLDMRWSFIGHRRALRAAVDQMIGWAPERIVIAHGRCYERDAVKELQRAFRWVL